FLSTFSSPSRSSGSKTSSLTISIGFPSSSRGACCGRDPPALYLAHLPPLFPRKPPLRLGVAVLEAASLSPSSETSGPLSFGGLPSLPPLRPRRMEGRARRGVAERDGCSEPRDG